MKKIKELLLKFLKPMALEHLDKLDLLAPMLSKKMVEKSHMTQEQANELAMDLIVVLKGELKVLIEKI